MIVYNVKSNDYIHDTALHDFSRNKLAFVSPSSALYQPFINPSTALCEPSGALRELK